MKTNIGTMVFQLHMVFDDPKFNGFGIDAPSLTRVDRNRKYDFSSFVYYEIDYKIPSLKKLWDNPKVLYEDKVERYNDFPAIPWIPVFSQRAVNVLRDFLEPNGELLPLTTKRGKYYAYQTLTVADGVLNVAKTRGEILKAPMFGDITTYSFYKSKLEGLTIFRVREHPSRVLVTTAFKERVEANGLLGFGLDQLCRIVDHWIAIGLAPRR